MLLINNRSIRVLSPTNLIPSTPKLSTIFVEDEKGNKKNLLSSRKQNEIYDNLKLNNMFVKSAEALAIQTNFEFDGEEYEAVLKKVGSSFKPVKVFMKNDKTLEEVEEFEFANGKDGEYHNVENLNKFFAALIFSINGQNQNKEYLNLNNDDIAFINKNIVEANKKTILKLNVYNIEKWVDMISNKISVSNFEEFKEDISAKMKAFFPNMKQEKIEENVGKYANMIQDGSFKNIDSDSITKVTLSDIPTLQRLSSGQIDVKKHPEFEARNLMLTKFLATSDFDINSCNATNYIMTGVSSAEIPIVYASNIFMEKKNNFKENTDKATNEIKNLLESGITVSKLREFIKEGNKNSDGYIYTNAYLNRLKKNIYASSDEKTIDTLYAITDAIISDINPDNKISDEMYYASIAESTKDKKTSLIKAVNAAMLFTRAASTNELDIKLTDDKTRINSTSFGKRLPIEVFYEGEQLINFAKVVGLENVNNDVDFYCGATIIGATTIAKENDQYVAKGTKRFYFKSTGFDDVGEVVGKIRKTNKNGELEYQSIDENFQSVSKVYKIDKNEKGEDYLTQNINKLNNLIKRSFMDSNGQIFKSHQNTIGKAIDSIEEMGIINKSSISMEEKINKIHSIIDNNDVLSKLVELSEIKKPDFKKIVKINSLVLNAPKLNIFLNERGGNLLSKLPNIQNLSSPDFIKDKDSSKEIAKTAVRGEILSLEKSLKFANYYSANIENNPDRTLQELKKYNVSDGYYVSKFYNKEDMDSIKKNGSFSFDKFLKDFSALTVAKHTGLNPSSNISKSYEGLIKDVFYPVKTEDNYYTTTQDKFTNLIYQKAKELQKPISDIAKEVDTVYENLLEGAKKPYVGYGFTYQAKESIDSNLKEDIDNIIVPTESNIVNKQEEVIEEEVIEEEVIEEEVIEEESSMSIDVDIDSIEGLNDEVQGLLEEELTKDDLLDLNFSDDFDNLEDIKIKIPTLEDISEKEKDNIIIEDYSAMPSM